MEEYSSILLFIVLALNLLLLTIKMILKESGYPVSWFRHHHRDLYNMFRLSLKSKKITRKIMYFSMALGFPLGVIAVPVAMICLSNPFGKAEPCAERTKFRQEEWKGVVTKKYNDKSNYNYPVIEIQNDHHVQIINDWDILAYGNFELINVGDSLVKKKAKVAIDIYRNGQKAELETDFRCD